MNCNFEKFLPDYLFQELSDERQKAISDHLKTCQSCRQQLHEFEQIHGELAQRQRPEPDKKLLKLYRSSLLQLFGKERQRYSWVQGAAVLRQKYFNPHPLFYRIAGAVTLILVGFFVGKTFYSSVDIQVVSRHETPNPVVSNIIDQDILYNYLTETEILLLGIENNPVSELQPDDVLINQQAAKRLLIQTVHIQQSSNAFSDRALLDYLDKVELLLLELSNAENDQIIDALSDVRRIVKETDLLDVVKSIQQSINNDALDQTV